MRSILAALGVLATLGSMLVIGCGDDEEPHHAQDEGRPGGPADPPGTDPPPGPPVRREFPSGTPAVGGFSLVEDFPNIEMTIPSAIVWPTADAPLVLERTGIAFQIRDGKRRNVLNIFDSVALVSEGGALGMALHPMFGDGTGAKPYAYIWYNAKGAPNNKQRLARFTWSAATQSFDRASELVLLEEDEQRPEHNGGRVAFGPDGFLYFGNGDDTNSANHQRLDRALFAGIFRIDVDQQGGAISHPPPRQPEGGRSSGYFIPNDNPFVGVPNALEEYFALGLRNPFGFSFDRSTGALWTGDVGETWREEIDRVVSGGNYGWPVHEGELVQTGAPLTLGAVSKPAFVYTHAEMADLTAILGGFVYRGRALPELAGKYIHSDWPSGRIWAVDVGATPATRTTLLDNDWRRIPMGIAEDPDGEIHLLHFDGIAKLTRDTSKSGDEVPKRLSETTLFRDLAGLVPEDKLVPYAIASPLWSDAAAKKRWIAVPPGQKVELAEDGALKFPKGTVLMKHFELPESVAPRGRTRRLETRVLVVGDETIYGLTYRWNAAGTDAELVREPHDEAIEDEAGGETRTWHFPAFGECWSCHRKENRVLGFVAQQLALISPNGTAQRDELVARGVFDAATVAKLPAPIASPSDAAASLDARASAYLAANCGSCHHEGASYLGGGDTWNAAAGVPLANRGLVGAPHHNTPMATKLGLRGAPLVAPGDPDGSILLARMKTTDPDLRMPPLGRHIVDPEGAVLIEQWIRAMPKSGQ